MSLVVTMISDGKQVSMGDPPDTLCCIEVGKGIKDTRHGATHAAS
jgi:hypothetical protein